MDEHVPVAQIEKTDHANAAAPHFVNTVALDADFRKRPTVHGSPVVSRRIFRNSTNRIAPIAWIDGGQVAIIGIVWRSIWIVRPENGDGTERDTIAAAAMDQIIDDPHS